MKPAAGPWVSLADAKPEPFEYVLVFPGPGRHGRTTVMQYAPHTKDVFRDDMFGDGGRKITHWARLTGEP